MRRLLSRHDLDDERVLIGFTAGVLWLVGALAGGVAQLLPGAPRVSVPAFLALDACVGAYGIASISGAIDWKRVSVRDHIFATAALTPLIGVLLLATGGQDSYLQPLLVLALFHVAYFFPLAVSIPLVAELVLVYASPFLYDHPMQEGFASRVLGFAVSGALLTAILRVLKGRLVAAERRQRRLALADPLTGLTNRRGFDEALHGAVAERGDPEHGRRAGDDEASFGLLVFDLDGFKSVNDTLGHPAGDALLKSVAGHCQALIRPGDTLARVGGDEFAVVAPGAGRRGVERLASGLLDAVEAAGARATVAWALHPEDGGDGEALLRTADRRLYAGKLAGTVAPNVAQHAARE